MARERYLLNDEESTIHANQIVPTTAKEKRQNWWFHNKVKVIAGVLIGACLFSLIWSVVSKENPDYSVMMMTGYGVPSELMDDLEEHFEAYAEDLNGDGDVVVAIQHCCFNTTSSSSYQAAELQAAFVRFAADAGAGDSMLFIYDDVSKAYLSQNDMEGFFGPFGDVTEEYVLWSDLESLKKLTIERYEKEGAALDSVQKVLGELKVSVRTQEGAAFEKEEKITYREETIEFFDRLRNDTPITE